MFRFVVAVVFLFQVQAAFADSKLYAGAQWGGSDFESDELAGLDVALESDFKTLGLSFGYMFISNLGVEQRVGLGLGASEETLLLGNTQIDVSYELDGYVSTYLRPEVTLGFAKIYGLLGYSKVKFSGSAELLGVKVEAEEDDNGLSYGLGIGLVNSDDFSFNVEVLKLIDAKNFSVDGINFVVQFPLWQKKSQYEY